MLSILRGNASATTSARRKFLLYLIKPSHYDDDGYVIQWLRSAIPSNSLAVLYGIASDCNERRVLGEDVDIEIDPDRRDQFAGSAGPHRARRSQRNGGFGMVGLVGVQSNQFPRALDIARPLRAAGVQVVHRRLSRLGLPGDASRNCRRTSGKRSGSASRCSPARPRAGSMIVLRDAARGALQPLYDFMKDLPGIEGAPLPLLPAERVSRTIGFVASFDAGRGCPFQCCFCTIINVQGRKSRYRIADDVEALIRANTAQGIKHFFITDDNLARNKNWEAIFDRLIHLREVERLKFKFVIQVDTLCHKIPNFIEKAARAGVKRVFIGLENINPESLRRRQEEAEPHRRLSRDAARLEEGALLHLCRLYPRLPDRHAGNASFATSRSSSANCRSTSWSSSA